jgi:hypothetical protein
LYRYTAETPFVLSGLTGENFERKVLNSTSPWIVLVADVASHAGGSTALLLEHGFAGLRARARFGVLACGPELLEKELCHRLGLAPG